MSEHKEYIDAKLNRIEELLSDAVDQHPLDINTNDLETALRMVRDIKALDNLSTQDQQLLKRVEMYRRVMIESKGYTNEQVGRIIANAADLRHLCTSMAFTVNGQMGAHAPDRDYFNLWTRPSEPPEE